MLMHKAIIEIRKCRIREREIMKRSLLIGFHQRLKVVGDFARGRGLNLDKGPKCIKSYKEAKR